MDTSIKAFDLFWNLYNSNQEFRSLVDEGISEQKVRFFSEEELAKIKSQNFIHPANPSIKEFEDVFILGQNIGNCVGMSRQLSYSYDDVDLVSGILPILKGTLNAEELSGHAWIETKDETIDTSLMLVIDKSLKDKFGYIEENRLTASKLRQDPYYQRRKEFTNDQSLKPKKK